jgi:hypothetical protein
VEGAQNATAARASIPVAEAAPVMASIAVTPASPMTESTPVMFSMTPEEVRASLRKIEIRPSVGQKAAVPANDEATASTKLRAAKVA